MAVVGHDKALYLAASFVFLYFTFYYVKNKTHSRCLLPSMARFGLNPLLTLTLVGIHSLV